MIIGVVKMSSKSVCAFFLSDGTIVQTLAAMFLVIRVSGWFLSVCLYIVY